MVTRIYLQGLIAIAFIFSAINHPCRAAEPNAGRQYYELRVYFTRSAEQQRRINDYWQSAAVPAYNRMGIQPIGVFTEMKDSVTNKIYVLIPCDSLEVFAAIPAKLAADTNYQQAAVDFLSAPKLNPAYDHFESSLLLAFNGMKHLTLPPAEKRPNVFELRTYLSPSEAKSLNKMQMFESGEIPVMKGVGLAPIFYSQTLAGPRLPSLVYMTCGENLAEHKKHWQGFNNAPAWKQLTSDPQYKDNMNGSISILLKRTSASQI
ncbi:MAG TPA: NIPSNAP family protein [Verrucomicrobiae bacterium]|jgi:hypothetical protein